MSRTAYLDSEEITARDLTADEKLLGAVIKQALNDGCDKPYFFRSITNKTTKKKTRCFVWNNNRESARRWFNDSLSTLNYFCNSLGLDIQYVRDLANKVFAEYDENQIKARRSTAYG